MSFALWDVCFHFVRFAKWTYSKKFKRTLYCLLLKQFPWNHIIKMTVLWYWNFSSLKNVYRILFQHKHVIHIIQQYDDNGKLIKHKERRGNAKTWLHLANAFYRLKTKVIIGKYGKCVYSAKKKKKSYVALSCMVLVLCGDFFSFNIDDGLYVALAMTILYRLRGIL